jgi:hypothetical protein
MPGAKPAIVPPDPVGWSQRAADDEGPRFAVAGPRGSGTSPTGSSKNPSDPGRASARIRSNGGRLVGAYGPSPGQRTAARRLGRIRDVRR